MNKIKFLNTIGLFLFLLTPLYSQFILPKYQSQVVDKNEMMIRWEPRTWQEWQTSLKEGYQIKVFGGAAKTSMQLMETQVVKPASEKEWEVAIANQSDTLLREFYQGAQSFLYMVPELETEIQKSLMDEPGKTMEENIGEFRMGYLVYSITYGMEMIEMAGLGFKMKIEDNKVYRIEVSTNGHDGYEFVYDPAQKTKPTLPKLSSEFGNKKVALSWSTPEHKEQYFGYYLSKSDNGKKYERVLDVPYVNILDTITTTPDAGIITEEVVLEKNYKDYWFKIKGMNYFGQESLIASVQKGYGFEEIQVMPIISYSDQTKDNEAEINWKVDRNLNRLIDHFAIYRSDELDGEYKVVLDSIPPASRTIKIPMEHNRNFFSVGIVPKDGPVMRSFSVFVMGQDTVPPIIPQNFVATIDTNGVVTLNWDRNVEEDLWGYKIFRSEFIEDEFAPMMASPMIDTFFLDTINLNSINEQIHYSIISLDKRNNRSAFAPIISLNRPDTIMPTPPLVRGIEFMEDSIKVEWASSSSQDVKLHQLFRRELNQEGWKMVAEFTSAESLNYFVDNKFELNKTYLYTVTATDDADLNSLPSRPLRVRTISRKPKKAFKRFDVKFDEKKATSSISWQLVDEQKLEEIIVYRGPNEAEISMYKILTPSEKEIVQDFEDNKNWYFLFKPIYNDGSSVLMSDIVEVKAPEGD